MLRDLGTKLGLVDIPVLKQAYEYSSQMDCGPSSQMVSSLRLSQTCKLVICLDLAASKHAQHLQESDKVRQTFIHFKYIIVLNYFNTFIYFSIVLKKYLKTPKKMMQLDCKVTFTGFCNICYIFLTTFLNHWIVKILFLKLEFCLEKA